MARRKAAEEEDDGEEDGTVTEEKISIDENEMALSSSEKVLAHPHHCSARELMARGVRFGALQGSELIVLAQKLKLPVTLEVTLSCSMPLDTCLSSQSSLLQTI